MSIAVLNRTINKNLTMRRLIERNLNGKATSWCNQCGEFTLREYKNGRITCLKCERVEVLA